MAHCDLGAGGNPWRADARPLGGAQMVDVETWLFFRNFDTIDILKKVFEIARVWKSRIQFFIIIGTMVLDKRIPLSV